MNMLPEVLCAGVVVVDHLCAPIDRLPRAGELLAAERMVLSLGGSAANTAVNLAKMGIRTAVAGCIGDDPFGRIAVELLREAAVDVELLRVCPGVDTSQSLILNVRGEDRRFISTFGANARFCAADMTAERVARSRVLYVGGYLVLPGLQHDALAAVSATARAAGVRTVLDVAVAGPGDSVLQLATILPHVDVFLPNNDEAEQITGECDPLRQAEQFHRLGAGTVVVTLGGAGSVLVGDGLRLQVGIYPVEFVDGSGGGDAFDAGYIYGLLKGLETEDCLRYAAALGASCVRAVGTTPSVFNRAECEMFLKQNSLRIERL